MKKLLVVGVIVLFLGLAVAPSINANIGRESELVEITTEICGLDGGKHTVRLTEKETEEVDRLFENIRLQLNESTSRGEAEEIFNDAVVELDKYGLLGGLSVKQAQRLVTDKYQNPRIVKLMNKFYNRNQRGGDENFDCLIVGKTSLTRFEGGFSFEALLDMFIRAVINHRVLIAFLLLFSMIIRAILPIELSIRKSISFGHQNWHFELGGEFYPSKGWIWTNGSNGVKQWDGSFFGQISRVEEYWGPIVLTYCVGTTEFKGIMIYPLSSGNDFFLGTASHVAVGPKYPWN